MDVLLLYVKAVETFGHQNTTNDGEGLEALGIAQRMTLLFGSLALLIVGIPGNLINLGVLRAKRLRGKYLSKLLRFISLFNLLQLIFGLSRYLIIGLADYDYTLQNSILCITFSMFTTTNHSLIIWLMVARAFVRLSYIMRPQITSIRLSALKCRAQTLTFYLSTAIVFITVIYLFYFHMPTEYTGLEDAIYFCDYWGPPQLVLMFYLPVSLLVIIDIACLKMLLKVGPKTKEVNAQVVILMSLSILVCLITILPYVLLFQLGLNPDQLDHVVHFHGTLGYVLSLLALYANYAVNYLPYYLVGNTFHRELLRTLARSPCWPGGKGLEIESTYTASTMDELAILKNHTPVGIHGVQEVSPKSREKSDTHHDSSRGSFNNLIQSKDGSTIRYEGPTSAELNAHTALRIWDYIHGLRSGTDLDRESGV